MSQLEERDYTYFTTVRGMCRFCRSIVPARVFFKDNKVWQQSLCPDCQTQPALIAYDKNWYLKETLKAYQDSSPLKNAREPMKGCPHDCGPCAFHASQCQHPEVLVTNACNLNCRICFNNNLKEPSYYITKEKMARTIDQLIKSAGFVDIINITGGEPTLHPDIMDILQICQRPEIGRITLNTNGLRLAQDYEFCELLGSMGIYVTLSFSTFDSKVSVKIHGEDIVETKLRAIDNLTKAGVPITLLNVMVRDINEEVAGGLLKLVQANDNILGITVQTMTYTGREGGSFGPRAHIPVDEAIRKICEHSSDILNFSDFIPLPSAHPLCYSSAYFIKSGDDFTPLACLASKEEIQSLIKSGYLIRLKDNTDFFQQEIDNRYAKDGIDKLNKSKDILRKLHTAGKTLSAFERQRIAETSIRAVLVHAYMDEDNFDCSRAMLCPDLAQVEPGKFMPACVYKIGL